MTSNIKLVDINDLKNYLYSGILSLKTTGTSFFNYLTRNKIRDYTDRFSLNNLLKIIEENDTFIYIIEKNDNIIGTFSKNTEHNNVTIGSFFQI